MYQYHTREGRGGSRGRGTIKEYIDGKGCREGHDTDR